MQLGSYHLSKLHISKTYQLAFDFSIYILFANAALGCLQPLARSNYEEMLKKRSEVNSDK